MIKKSIQLRFSKSASRGTQYVKMSNSYSTGSGIIGYAEDDVLFNSKNMARVVTLNRPKKLNSLNTSMVSKIEPRLVEYSKSKVNNMVILTSSSEKALCAGGDVAEVAKQIKEGNAGYGSDFFQREYNLNYLIASYPKPYVSIMDGITMGGGVGLSVHAPFRIATEKTKLTMPEMDIGFFPDVGTTFFLPRLDDKIGYYIALTGQILSGLDAYMLGFATHYVPSDRIPQLINRLSNLQPPTLNDAKVEDTHSSTLENSKQYFAQVNQIIEEFTETKLPEGYKYPFSVQELKIISEAFSQSSIEHVLDYLKNNASEFALSLHDKLIAKSPTSLKVAFELLSRGSKNSIREQFEQELIAATNLVNTKPEESDFVKGVSHKLIDKIKEPNFPEWKSAQNPDGIPSDAVNKILSKSIHTAKLSDPLINRYFGINYKQYPYNMGLPFNRDVEAYITGNDGSGRSYLPTPKEVYKHFNRISNNKLGVDLKVNTILEMHGEASTYDNKYVSWVK
ncbi:Piso0_001621 [Millerozyma farinosa CBS 7064]|uniref:3-hydroxyisobutyryl-CoA hydrolase n=1 Tax=Pichia sorbitophila (strain ATCC MYA-4447 / BCRC 22081 / CBS 7064 / NBRC 10061 / NRRL Y-12695) TaxID=559304 RepID=G8YLA1_PICSO|nr:Piso0_001621 [Millerozyma farinosa CBS 7064]